MRVKRILSPIDFSPTSEYALQYAVNFARGLGAEVHAVHVYQLPAYAWPDGAVMGAPELAGKLSEHLQRQVEETIDRHKDPSVKVEGHVVEGTPHQAIGRAVKALDADLIIMGTHGRTGLPHLLLGSIAERVVRTAEVPVLTVRKPKHST